MRKIIGCLTFLIFHTSLFSQKDTVKRKSRFSFEYAIGYQKLKMKDLNQYYLDSFALKFDLFDKHISNAAFFDQRFMPWAGISIGKTF